MSFGKWLLTGLQEDSLIAVLVLVLLICIIAAICIAAGYGVHLVFAKYL